MRLTRVFSGAPWESKVGYCRAVKAGEHIYVSGTAPIDEEGQVFAPGDAYLQARCCLEIMERALQELGCGRESVVPTRMFVTDISRWEEYGRAHRGVLLPTSPGNVHGGGEISHSPRHVDRNGGGRRPRLVVLPAAPAKCPL